MVHNNDPAACNADAGPSDGDCGSLSSCGDACGDCGGGYGAGRGGGVHLFSGVGGGGGLPPWWCGGDGGAPQTQRAALHASCRAHDDGRMWSKHHLTETTATTILNS